jgi:hypothetical protein
MRSALLRKISRPAIFGHTTPALQKAGLSRLTVEGSPGRVGASRRMAPYKLGREPAACLAVGVGVRSGCLVIRRRHVVFGHVHLKAEAMQAGAATMEFCAAHREELETLADQHLKDRR